jgi:hypothetical protein
VNAERDGNKGGWAGARRNNSGNYVAIAGAVGHFCRARRIFITLPPGANTMHHFSLTLPRLLAIVFTVLMFGTGEAQARKRGFTLITTGTALSEIGPMQKERLKDLAPDDRLLAEKQGWDTVGFQYSHFGVFWLDIWNWGGEYALYNKVSEAGSVVPDEMAAEFLGVDVKKLGKPLNYRLPYGLMIVLGLVSLKFVPRILASRRAKRQQVPDFMPPAPTGAPAQPRWTPQNPPPGAPGTGGPPPVPPPLPPEQQ